MRSRWLGFIVFILAFVLILVFFANFFPYDNSRNNWLNRILPLGGVFFGQEPQAWIGDLATNQRVAGKGRQNLSRQVDVDFIKVNGQWYKIKGPVYITKGGSIMGWHRRLTRQEAETLRQMPIAQGLL